MAGAPLALSLLTGPRQDFLFDPVDLGSELLTIDRDAQAGKHTGTTLERRRALYDEICLRLAEGVSMRKISKTYGVSRNTLAGIQQRLVTSGKMEPYKKRVSAKLGAVVEMSADLLMERLESGDVPTNVLPIAMGVASDKKALIDGEPTSIVVTAEVGLNQESWDGFLAGISKPKEIEVTVTPVAPADAQSTGKATNDQ